MFHFSFVVIIGRGGKKGAVETCTGCKGNGIQVHTQQFGPGMIQQIQIMCRVCHGKGEFISEKDRCKTCQGTKVCIYYYIKGYLLKASLKN